jgi:hypothetical protein
MSLEANKALVRLHMEEVFNNKLSWLFSVSVLKISVPVIALSFTSPFYNI